MDYVAAIMFILPQSKWHYSEDVMPEGGWTYQHIVWDDIFFLKPTEEELNMAYKYAMLSNQDDYRMRRKECYPTAEEQLQMIYDLGIDGWKQRIDNVKNNIPKPSLSNDMLNIVNNQES